MDKHGDSFRGYVWSNKAWYANVVDTTEVMFGMYSTDGSTTGEMAMRWYDLNNKSVPRLEVFDDAWGVLVQFHDLVLALAEKDNKNITPKRFVEILKKHQFKDLTKYVQD